MTPGTKVRTTVEIRELQIPAGTEGTVEDVRSGLHIFPLLVVIPGYPLPIPYRSDELEIIE